MIKYTLLVGLLLSQISIAQLRYDGGFETGDHSQWADLNWNLNRPESEQFQIVTSPVRQGLYSAKTIVHDGDEFLNTGGERCDLEIMPNQREHEGDDLWYAFSVQFDSNWQNPGPPPGDWLLIADWHASGNYPNICQVMQLETDGTGALILHMLTGDVQGYDCYDGSGSAYYYSEPVLSSISAGLWHDFVFHVVWTSSNNGSVELWHLLEGENYYTKIADLHNIPTLQYKTNPNNPDVPYFILAHYRSDLNTHTSILYHDGFRIATNSDALIEGDLYNVFAVIFKNSFE
ncbi:MAG TPA: hypothetical protein ENJ44_01425 [Oceanospirillales bacterium]|nr:hypothetical protein [Oceanospirillales bacterium]